MFLQLLSNLKQVFGFDGFREGQEQAIRQLIDGQSSLAIFPTGSGKSLCYQLSALHLPHLTLVVSPLLALIKDQLTFLEAKGIPAASIDSSLSAEQHQQVIQNVKAGNIKILMVSVERFKNERFRRFISSVAISQLVVDEAHCISEWGHNFRPDYLKLPAYKNELNIPQVLLLTATATAKVKKDMAAKFAIQPQHIVQTGFYRANLNLSVVPVAQQHKNQELINTINQQSGCGIVYVTLQQTAEVVAQYLQQQGINAQAYHAGFADDKKQDIQQRFMSGNIPVMVATIAFGMGIDKSDIRFVVHYDLPKSIENYSQEIGRAGRDGQQSNCITLANLDSLHTLENFVYGDTPTLNSIELLLENIKKESQHNQWEVQITGLSNDTNIRQLPLKTLLVQLELMGMLTPKHAYFAEFKYKFLAKENDIVAMFEGERKTFLQAVFANTQFKKIWGEPDFLSLQQQYQCDRSRVVTALDYLHEKKLIELQTKKMTEVYQVVPQQLNSPDLAQQVFVYFTEKEQSEINRIAALIRFFELDRCLSKNLSLYFDDKQSPENCNHCSVCLGQVAKLAYSSTPQWPDDNTISDACIQLTEHLKAAGIVDLPISIYCQFLVGLTVPMFTKQKVKKLSGFAMCEALKYGEVKGKVQALMGS
ncbi:ATP-dependent DNA helicase RecQ [Colwellia sp. RE-S-Sl-9]